MLEDILKFNKEFVQNRGYEKYLTNKYPFPVWIPVCLN